jgi:hypothetical protein
MFSLVSTSLPPLIYFPASAPETRLLKVFSFISILNETKETTKGKADITFLERKISTPANKTLFSVVFKRCQIGWWF